MKKLIIIFAVVLILSSSSFAQTKFALSATGGVNIGMSDFADAYGNGYNGTLTFLYSAVVSTDLTFSIGYNKWNKEERSFTSIPLEILFLFQIIILVLE